MANLINRILGDANQAAVDESAPDGPAPIHVTDSDFEDRVLGSEVPVIVDFWAPWCMPCRMIAPILEKMTGEYDGRALIAKVNTDENPQWAIKYGVQGIPTLLFFKNGEIEDRVVGVVPAAQIKKRLEKLF